MRSRVLGIVGVLWGGAILARACATGTGLDFSSAYAAGHSTGLGVGLALLLAGAWSLVRHPEA